MDMKEYHRQSNIIDKKRKEWLELSVTRLKAWEKYKKIADAEDEIFDEIQALRTERDKLYHEICNPDPADSSDKL